MTSPEISQPQSNALSEASRTAPRSKKMLSALLLLVSLGIGMGLLEIAVRVLHLPGMRVEPRYFYSPHETLGWTLAPDFKTTVTTGEFSTPVSMNSKGFRDVEHSPEKPEGVFRIVGLGDSFTFGFGVNFEQTYLRLTENRLNTDRPEHLKFEIIKTGTPGYGFLQEYHLFRDSLIHYMPDLVLVGYDVNDHIDSIEPLDTVYKGFLIDQNSINSLFLDLKIFSYAHSQSIYLTAKTGRFIKNKLFPPTGGIPLQDPDKKKAYLEKALQSTEQTMKELKELCQSNGIRLCVVFIPHRSQVHPKKFPPDAYSYYFDVLPGFLEELCKKNNTAYINLLPAFQESADRGFQLYYNFDGHWNPEGHQLAANIIYEKLKELNLINFAGTEIR